MSFLEEVLDKAKKRVLFSQHAIDQMNKPNRLISPSEVIETIFSGQMIEDYPEDPRGHSCLIFGKTKSERVLHIVCSPKEEYLFVITTYCPDPEQWDVFLQKRKR